MNSVRCSETSLDPSGNIQPQKRGRGWEVGEDRHWASRSHQENGSAGSLPASGTAGARRAASRTFELRVPAGRPAVYHSRCCSEDVRGPGSVRCPTLGFQELPPSCLVSVTLNRAGISLPCVLPFSSTTSKSPIAPSYI